MTLLTRCVVLASRVRALFTSRRLDDELDAEMAAHVALLTEEYVRRGFSRDEAHRAAMLRFGGPMQLKEQHRDDRGLPFLDTTLQDIRYGFRALRRNPAFALVAIGTLAIGIGAGTAVFTIARAVLLRPLPYADPEELDAQHRRACQLRRLEEAEHGVHRHRGVRAIQQQRQRRLGRVSHRLR